MQATMARSGAVGFDTATPLTASLVQSLLALDYEFAIRYVSHGTSEARDLTSDEAQMITDAGMALMIVVHPPAPGWTPTAALGVSHAAAAIGNIPIEVPGGTTVWCDLEGLVKTPSGIVCAYMNSWTAVIRGAGFEPGLYVGYDTWLTGAQLFEGLTLDRYWKSASAVPSPSPRGWCMQQTLGVQPVAGIQLDRDAIAADALGGLPTWAVAG